MWFCNTRKHKPLSSCMHSGKVITILLSSGGSPRRDGLCLIVVVRLPDKCLMALWPLGSEMSLGLIMGSTLLVLLYDLAVIDSSHGAVEVPRQGLDLRRHHGASEFCFRRRRRCHHGSMEVWRQRYKGGVVVVACIVFSTTREAYLG